MDIRFHHLAALHWLWVVLGLALVIALGLRARRRDLRRFASANLLPQLTASASAARRRIRAGLLRNRIALYWIHLRSYNSPALDSTDPSSDHAPEVVLHRFFSTLSTPYRVYESEAKEDLARAVADVGRQQNFPLDYVEQFPRADAEALNDTPASVRSETPKEASLSPAPRPEPKLVGVPETPPTTIPGWIVREVADGRAVVQGPNGVCTQNAETIAAQANASSIPR